MHRAVAFDAFPVLDPRPVFALAEQLFPERGAELSALWRARQFEYQWLRSLAGQFADFWRTTDDALAFAARSVGLPLSAEQRDRLMGSWLELRAWPDVREALAALRGAGIRLAFVSNATNEILERGIRNSGLDGVFEHVLSTSRIHAHKPDPRAYGMALDAFGLPRDEIAFAAFAGWDVAGAKWFGYTTFWVNRANAPAEGLGVAADAVGRNLHDLAQYLGASGG